MVREKQARQAAIIYAGVLLLMAVGQAVALDKFAAIVASYDITTVWAHALAISITSLSILALPFLFGMRIHHAILKISMASGLIVPILWLGLILYALFAAGLPMNSGILGAYVAITSGTWTVPFFLSLFIVAFWATLGLYGSTRKQPRTV